MDPERTRQLLDDVRAGRATIDEAMATLRELPFRALGFAHADTHRHLRTGCPEVILGSGKTPAQIATLLVELGRGGGPVMATRVPADAAAQVNPQILIVQNAGIFPAADEKVVAVRMKRGYLHLRDVGSPQVAPHSLAHLVRSIICVGERQNLAGLEFSLTEELRCSELGHGPHAGDGVNLSVSGADQNGSFAAHPEVGVFDDTPGEHRRDDQRRSPQRRR